MFSGDNFEQPSADRVAVRQIKRRRSKSAGPIFALLMLSAAVGGLILTYQNFDVLVKLGRGKADTNSGSTGSTSTQPVENDEGGNASNLGSTEKSGVESEPASNVEETIPNPDSEQTTEQEKELAGGITEPQIQIATESNSNNDSDNENENEKLSNSEPTTDEIQPSGEVESRVVSLDKDQLFAARRVIERGYRSLYRREFDTARNCFKAASSVLNSVKESENDLIAPEQESALNRISDSEQLTKYVEGFWKQVDKSANSISGAQEIIVGSQIVGFVEAMPQSVIIRRTGQNIEYKYSFCPPGLAVAIAEQGAIDDIPTWNLQKAAFYSFDQYGGRDHTRRINEFLAIAEDAGHDCANLRRLGKLDLDGLGLPETKLDPVSKSKSHPEIEQFRNDRDYKTPKQLDAQTARQFAEALFSRANSESDQTMAFLEEARLLAIRAGAASLAEDIVYEMGVWGDVERAKITCATFTEICKEKLEPAQARQHMERSIGFLNSILAESASARDRENLKERLLKLAQRFKMADANLRLNQIKI